MKEIAISISKQHCKRQRLIIFITHLEKVPIKMAHLFPIFYMHHMYLHSTDYSRPFYNWKRLSIEFFITKIIAECGFRKRIKKFGFIDQNIFISSTGNTNHHEQGGTAVKLDDLYNELWEWTVYC